MKKGHGPNSETSLFKYVGSKSCYATLEKTVYLSNIDFECIIVTVNIGSCKVCVCVVYCPPDGSIEFLDSLYNTLNSLDVDLFSSFFSLEILISILFTNSSTFLTTD